MADIHLGHGALSRVSVLWIELPASVGYGCLWILVERGQYLTQVVSCCMLMSNNGIRMEVALSWPDYLPTMSAAITFSTRQVPHLGD